jgi:hypothetical protein
MCRIAIIGSRDFNDYEYLKQKLIKYICSNFDTFEEKGKLYRRRNTWPNILIISGGAKGADTLAEKFADEYNLEKLIFKPDWDLYGKRAGFVRNAKIVDNCDVLFAFQINKSKGTQHSIDLAKEKSKEVYVFEVEGENNGI